MTDPNEQLVGAVDQLRGAINQLRDELVRKDVFDQVQNNWNTRFKNIEDDVSEMKTAQKTAAADRKADRRLIIATFVGPFVMLLIGVYIAAQVGGVPT